MPWEVKKEFYTALSNNVQTTREKHLNEAVRQGLVVSKKRLAELKNATASNLLSGLADVSDWDKTFVEKPDHEDIIING